MIHKNGATALWCALAEGIPKPDFAVMAGGGESFDYSTPFSRFITGNEEETLPGASRRITAGHDSTKSKSRQDKGPVFLVAMSHTWC
jgi:hypothetical protein